MFSVIRKFTDEDEIRLNRAAERFCERHGLHPQDWRELTDYLTNVTESGYLARSMYYNWMKCYCRALRIAYDSRAGVAWGNVGIWVD